MSTMRDLRIQKEKEWKQRDQLLMQSLIIGFVMFTLLRIAIAVLSVVVMG